MEYLSINKFKAFSEQLEIATPNRENVLMCGENGAGKSSIFDAIRYIFYYDKMMQEGVELGETPERKLAKMTQNEISYINKQHSGESIEIKFNGNNCRTMDLSDYEVYMVSPNDIRNKDRINLREILERAYIPQSSVDIYLQYSDDTINFVNVALEKSFGETIRLQKLDDSLDCKLLGDNGLESKDELPKYFNEARLSIVFLLIIFSYIKTSSSTHKKRILVLDDFITSLDVAYRIGLVKYILSEFDGYQKIIFTHSPSFYNLIESVIKMDQKKFNSWKRSQLYAIEDKHVIHDGKEFTSASVYRQKWIDTLDDDGIGNDVRQYIEVLASELNGLYHLTAHEGTKNIIQTLATGKPSHMYLKLDAGNKLKTVFDLIDDIESVLNTAGKLPNERCKNIKQTIQEYRNFDAYTQIKEIFQDLYLYQKVVLHPSSHGSTGIRHFTSNEVLYSIALADKLEKLIHAMREYNSSGDVYSY